MDSEQLGKRLKTVREIFKLSQTEVAEKLGVTQTYIFRLENGKGMNSDFLIKALEFYASYISLDRLFNEKMSILEIMQEELVSPTSELLKNRASLIRESVNELFEQYQTEQNSRLADIQNRFNAKMEALEAFE